MVDRFKNTLRRSCQQVRANLPPAYQKAASAQVCARVRSLEPYRYAKRIALYHADNGEINLKDLWNSAPLQGKFCYFPVLNEENKTLLFLPATPATAFSKNRYGIAEPNVDRSQALAPKQIDLIFVPLVLFDNYGTRLGRGAGYYDRTLAQEEHPMLIGVAYEFQRYPYLQPQAWDIPLTAVVTQSNVYWSKK